MLKAHYNEQALKCPECMADILYLWCSKRVTLVCTRGHSLERSRPCKCSIGDILLAGKDFGNTEFFPIGKKKWETASKIRQAQ